MRTQTGQKPEPRKKAPPAGCFFALVGTGGPSSVTLGDGHAAKCLAARRFIAVDKSGGDRNEMQASLA